MEPPPEEPNNAATLVGLAAAILLVALAVWLLVAFKHSSETLDCLAAHHRDC
jgi:flagellar biogenesis protein FliO